MRSGAPLSAGLKNFSFQKLFPRWWLYARLARLHKPIGTLLLLWPTLWAVWLAADGHPRWWVVGIFSVGTLLMRSAGCVMNDLADAEFDRHVKRTRERPLAAGLLSRRQAGLFGLALTLLAFPLVLPFNGLTIGLAFVALFLAFTYPYMKRYIVIPQAYLGVAFGFGIPMAYAAQLDRFPAEGAWLLVANIFWAIAYDTEYAMVDRDDDLRIGIKTSAITLGRLDVAAVMCCYAAMLIVLSAIGVSRGFGSPYFAGLVVAAGMMLRHFFMIRLRAREGCFRAFNDNNWVGAAIFAGICLQYLLQ